MSLIERFPSKYGIVGKSEKMIELYRDIELVAPTNSTVFIRGDSGTGKELVSKAIHRNSRRQEKPYIEFNCAAVPSDLLESELFGHQKGAFTGAYSTKQGKLELVDGGTLFLDEIADMGLNIQPKFLRALEYGEFERVGGLETKKVDVRLIAATSKDVEELIRTDQFRKELYYRINVIPLYIPPLKQREGDIGLLIDYFIEKNEGKGISKGAKDVLVSYDWPGNVRQLKAVIERLVLHSKPDSGSEPSEISLGLVEKHGKLQPKIDSQFTPKRHETAHGIPGYGLGDAIDIVESGISAVKKYLDDHNRGMERLGNMISQLSVEFSEGHNAMGYGALSKRIADFESRMAIAPGPVRDAKGLPRRIKKIEKPHGKPDNAAMLKGESVTGYLTLNDLSHETGISVSTLRAPIFRGAMKSTRDGEGILVNSSDVLGYFKVTDNQDALGSLGKYMKNRPEFTIRISGRRAYRSR